MKAIPSTGIENNLKFLPHLANKVRRNPMRQPWIILSSKSHPGPSLAST